MEPIPFTVDSKILRELGERLVGRPHIALAELVKNSYDADASHVVINFGEDYLEIVDDGHGMSRDSFISRWMRIGTTHKEAQQTSPRLHRPLTGSKGVGRLSVQLLADTLELRTVSIEDESTELLALVDWSEAIDAGSLTKAMAMVGTETPNLKFAEGKRHGTRLILRNLRQDWTVSAIRDLARELWPLQPPFGDSSDSQGAFVVRVEPEELGATFDSEMRVVLDDLWTARVVGEMLPLGGPPPRNVAELEFNSAEEIDGDGWDASADFSRDDAVNQIGAPDRIVRLTIQFRGEAKRFLHYRIRNCHLDAVKYEIRVFDLQRRQPRNIPVAKARTYLRRFGGIHVYDAGFHLPYYGPDADWLHIEMDHSHRLSRSQLLPENLQVGNGLRDLPTNSRMFGIVEVDTARSRGNGQRVSKGKRVFSLRLHSPYR